MGLIVEGALKIVSYCIYFFSRENKAQRQSDFVHFFWVKEVFLSTAGCFCSEFLFSFLFLFFFFFNRIGKSRISVRVLGIVVLRTTLESPVLDFSGESKCLFGIVFRRNSKSDLQVCGFN